MLTADAGLVHVQWKVTYKIDDVSSYVSNIGGKSVEAAESLIRTFVENVGIQLATELTAEELIRTRVDFVQSEMRRRINEQLASVDSGIKVHTRDTGSRRWGIAGTGRFPGRGR